MITERPLQESKARRVYFKPGKHVEYNGEMKHGSYLVILERVPFSQSMVAAVEEETITKRWQVWDDDMKIFQPFANVHHGKAFVADDGKPLPFAIRPRWLSAEDELIVVKAERDRLQKEVDEWRENDGNERA